MSKLSTLSTSKVSSWDYIDKNKEAIRQIIEEVILDPSINIDDFLLKVRIVDLLHRLNEINQNLTIEKVAHTICGRIISLYLAKNFDLFFFYTLKRIKCRHAANDIIQDLSERALNCDHFSEIYYLEGWLKLRLKYMSLRHYTKKQYKPFASLPIDDLLNKVFVEDIGVITKEEVDYILSKMPKSMGKMVFQLHFQLDQSHKDISEFLNITEGYSRVLLKRTKDVFVQIYRRINGFDPDPNGPDDDSGGGAGGGGGSNPGNSIKERNCKKKHSLIKISSKGKQNLSQILSDPNSKIVQQMVDLKFDPEFSNFDFRENFFEFDSVIDLPDTFQEAQPPNHKSPFRQDDDWNELQVKEMDVSIRELLSYLNQDLPLDKKERLDRVLQKNEFYQEVLEGIKLLSAEFEDPEELIEFLESKRQQFRNQSETIFDEIIDHIDDEPNPFESITFPQKESNSGKVTLSSDPWFDISDKLFLLKIDFIIPYIHNFQDFFSKTLYKLKIEHLTSLMSLKLSQQFPRVQLAVCRNESNSDKLISISLFQDIILPIRFRFYDKNQSVKLPWSPISTQAKSLEEGTLAKCFQFNITQNLAWVSGPPLYEKPSHNALKNFQKETTDLSLAEIPILSKQFNLYQSVEAFKDPILKPIYESRSQLEYCLLNSNISAWINDQEFSINKTDQIKPIFLNQSTIDPKELQTFIKSVNREDELLINKYQKISIYVKLDKVLETLCSSLFRQLIYPDHLQKNQKQLIPSLFGVHISQKEDCYEFLLFDIWDSIKEEAQNSQRESSPNDLRLLPCDASDYKNDLVLKLFYTKEDFQQMITYIFSKYFGLILHTKYDEHQPFKEPEDVFLYQDLKKKEIDNKDYLQINYKNLEFALNH